MRRYPALLPALLLPLATLLGGPPATATTTTATGLLSTLSVAAEAGSTTYGRTHFGGWVDADGDSCDTREEVLVAESAVLPRLGTGCSVLSGSWVSWYDGVTWTVPSDVDIDHVVALKEAWESGARLWSPAERRLFANDLGFAWSLDAVTDSVNASKGDRDPAAWMPPLSSVHCAYATHWVAVKHRWRLSVDAAERAALASVLSGSCGAQEVAVPPRAR